MNPSQEARVVISQVEKLGVGSPRAADHQDGDDPPSADHEKLDQGETIPEPSKSGMMMVTFHHSYVLAREVSLSRRRFR